MVQPFADISDVEARWRPLSDSEVDVAATLLQDASDMIVERWSDVEDRVAEGSLSDTALTRETALMVKRAMNQPLPEGLESFTQNAGPFGFGGKVANPNGNLSISANLVRLIEGDSPPARIGWLL